ncbi:MAG TPA: hypothetical protein VFR29_00775 [Steroidobacteraceae bacterium]|nr:hypothetical protein [Steroidobacteraceae bacterium]
MSFPKNPGLRALGAAVAAAVALSACSGGSANDALPLIRATLTIKTVSQGGVCDSVRVRLTPKELIGESNKYANNKMMVAEVAMTGPTDENGAPMCNGTGETLPMASGNWEFTAPLASGTASCVRMIEPAGDLSVVFIDGVEGCGGNGNGVTEIPLEMVPGSEVPAEDAAAPAEPTTG